MVGRNEIAAADLGAIDVEFARGEIEQPLHHEHALRLASAAHRSHRHFVSECDFDIHPEGRNDIGE